MCAGAESVVPVFHGASPPVARRLPAPPTSSFLRIGTDPALLWQVVTHVYHTNRIALEMFEAAGFTVNCQISGLGRIEAIQALYAAHTKAAIDSLNG